jgi:hypothetical protein
MDNTRLENISGYDETIFGKIADVKSAITSLVASRYCNYSYGEQLRINYLEKLYNVKNCCKMINNVRGLTRKNLLAMYIKRCQLLNKWEKIDMNESYRRKTRLCLVENCKLLKITIDYYMKLISESNYKKFEQTLFEKVKNKSDNYVSKDIKEDQNIKNEVVKDF